MRIRLGRFAGFLAIGLTFNLIALHLQHLLVAFFQRRIAHFHIIGRHALLALSVAAFTIIAAQELHRYGVTVNAIAPAALTRMTENLGMGQVDEEGKEILSPRWIAPICTWLVSKESAPVTGRVFEASGQVLGIANMWHRGPTVDPVDEPSEIGPLVQKMMAEAQPNSDMSGAPATGPGRPTSY